MEHNGFSDANKLNAQNDHSVSHHAELLQCSGRWRGRDRRLNLRLGGIRETLWQRSYDGLAHVVC